MSARYASGVRAALILAGLTQITACLETRMTPEIPMNPSAKAVAVVVSGIETPVQYHVYAGNTPGLEFSAVLGADDRVRAVALGCSLEDLGITPGWQSSAGSTRPLPVRSFLVASELDADRQRWVTLDDVRAFDPATIEVDGDACSSDQNFARFRYMLQGRSGAIDAILPSPEGEVLFVDRDEHTSRVWTVTPTLASGTEISSDSQPSSWLASFVARSGRVFAVDESGVHWGTSFAHLDEVLTAPIGKPKTAWLSGSPDGRELCVQLGDGRSYFVDADARELMPLDRAVTPSSDTGGGAAWIGPSTCVVLSPVQKRAELWEHGAAIPAAFGSGRADVQGIASIPNLGVLTYTQGGALELVDGSGAPRTDQLALRPGEEVSSVVALDETFFVVTRQRTLEYVPGRPLCPEVVSLDAPSNGVYLVRELPEGFAVVSGSTVDVIQRRGGACSRKF